MATMLMPIMSNHVRKRVGQQLIEYHREMISLPVARPAQALGIPPSL